MTPPLLIAILAAGASRRLGQPKQLVAIQGTSLLRRQCKVACDADIGAVTVILGCNADSCRAAVVDMPLSIHLNEQWAGGLGTSIACAARAAEDAAMGGLLILHMDQFAISVDDLRSLYKVWDADRLKVVRSRSGSYIGPPVIFPASSFAELKQLSGDDGAKSVIVKLGRASVLEVDIPSAMHDLDTPEQLAKLR